MIYNITNYSSYTIVSYRCQIGIDNVYFRIYILTHLPMINADRNICITAIPITNRNTRRE